MSGDTTRRKTTLAITTFSIIALGILRSNTSKLKNESIL
jgi:hypothetical protein